MAMVYGMAPTEPKPLRRPRERVDAQPFGAVIRAVRAGGMTLHEIAAHTGVSESTLSDLMHGRPTVYPETAAKLRSTLPTLLPSAPA
jgi:hypothetical protein